MSVTKEWWEGICEELARNPAAATKTITDFRDSEQALEASKYFLQPSTGCTANAQFQSALILQYVCLKHWGKLTVTDIQELRTTLWTLIHSSIAAGSMPYFALNKIMQVYALLWKRGWHDSDITARQQLFQQIRAFMQSPQYMKSGATLLRTVVEEFSSRSSAEIGLPIEFHRVAHAAYENLGLDDSMEIAAQALATSFDTVAKLQDDPESVVIAAGIVAETTKLLVELMNWDFDSAEKFAYLFRKESDMDRERQRSTDLLALPRKWAGVFLQAGFVDGVCNAYEKLRVVYTHYSKLQAQCMNHSLISQNSQGQGSSSAAAGGALKASELALNELRLLLSAVASITGDFFQDDAEKVLLCGHLVARVVPMLTTALDRSPIVHIFGASPGGVSGTGGHGGVEARSLEELRAVECLHTGTVVLRLLGNYRLSIASRMASSLFEGLVTVLARATFELSQELALLADLQLSIIYSTTNNNHNATPSSAGVTESQMACHRMGLVLEEGETSLLTGWRGDTVEVLLEAWCMVLDDPLMMHTSVSSPSMSSPSSSQSTSDQQGAYIVTHLRTGLERMAVETFQQLFECMLKTTLQEALSGAEEEEDCDEDDYMAGSGTVASLVGPICTVGRASFTTALHYVCTSVARSLTDADHLHQALTTQSQGLVQGIGLSSPSHSPEALHRESLRVLEALRIGMLFLSHLCMDDFRESSEVYSISNRVSNGSSSSDTPTIPPFVVDAFGVRGSKEGGVDAGAVLREAVGLAARILQLQLSALQYQPSSSGSVGSQGQNQGGSGSEPHPLLSPLLLKGVCQFFTEYSIRYVDPDPALYNPSILHEAPMALQIHRLYGEDFYPIVDLLTTTAYALVLRLPLESDLVVAVAELLSSLSRCGVGARASATPRQSQQQQEPERIVDYLIGRPAISDIFTLVTGPHQGVTCGTPGTTTTLCRLNADGIAAVYGALGSMAARSSSSVRSSSSMFTQLCVKIHDRVGTATASSDATQGGSMGRGGLHSVLIEHAIAAMRGVAVIPRGKPQEVLHQLFDGCLPRLSPCIQTYVNANDDVLRAYMLLLRDYAEAQLPYCSTRSSHTVYGASLAALERCSARLRLPMQSVTAAAEEESAYRSDLILIALQLLNHLATKDFLVDEDMPELIENVLPGQGLGSLGTSLPLGQQVPTVLLFGLEALVPLLSADILRSYPTTADRYFSFVSLILNAYQDEFARLIHTHNNGLGGDLMMTPLQTSASPSSSTGTLLTTLVQHLLWGAGAVDSTCARLALQSLQTLAAYQGTSMKCGGEGFGLALASELFPRSMERLLEMLLFPATCEYGISQDRVDACANALITCIALENPPQRFMQCVHSLVASQQEEYIRQALIACFDKLTTEGGVSLTKTDKPNRQQFVKNLRQFVLEVRPLVLFH